MPAPGHFRRIQRDSRELRLGARCTAPLQNPSSRPQKCCVSVVRHGFAISQQVLLEVCLKFVPSSIRGRRECRAPDAPAARVCEWGSGWRHTQYVRSHRKSARHSPRDGYDSVLPSERTFSHRRRQSCLHRLDTHVGVSGPHAFVRLRHQGAFRVHRSPPRVDDVRATPLWSEQDGKRYKLICYF
jgi:hypothetical protein